MYILKFKNTETIESWLQANIYYIDSFIEEIKDKTKLNTDGKNIVKYLETANLLDLGLCVEYHTHIPIEACRNRLPNKITLIMNSHNHYNFFNRLELIKVVCKDCINYTCCNFSS